MVSGGPLGGRRDAHSSVVFGGFWKKWPASQTRCELVPGLPPSFHQLSGRLRWFSVAVGQQTEIQLLGLVRPVGGGSGRPKKTLGCDKSPRSTGLGSLGSPDQTLKGILTPWLLYVPPRPPPNGIEFMQTLRATLILT